MHQMTKKIKSKKARNDCTRIRVAPSKKSLNLLVELANVVLSAHYDGMLEDSKTYLYI